MLHCFLEGVDGLHLYLLGPAFYYAQSPTHPHRCPPGTPVACMSVRFRVAVLASPHSPRKRYPPMSHSPDNPASVPSAQLLALLFGRRMARTPSTLAHRLPLRRPRVVPVP